MKNTYIRYRNIRNTCLLIFVGLAWSYGCFLIISRVQDAFLSFILILKHVFLELELINKFYWIYTEFPTLVLVLLIQITDKFSLYCQY